MLQWKEDMWHGYKDDRVFIWKLNQFTDPRINNFSERSEIEYV
jgi:hypothetical protein